MQHNLAKFTSTTTFNGPLHHTAGCCFPIDGTASTVFKGGPWDGKTETITFGPTCGQASVAGADGSTVALTLTHCI